MSPVCFQELKCTREGILLLLNNVNWYKYLFKKVIGMFRVLI